MARQLDEILKETLSGMSDEEFERIWSGVSDFGGVSLDDLKVMNEKLAEYEPRTESK